MAFADRLVHLRVILNAHGNYRVLELVPHRASLNIQPDNLKNRHAYEKHAYHQNAGYDVGKSAVRKHSFFQTLHFQNTSLVPSAVAEMVIGAVLNTKKLKS